MRSAMAILAMVLFAACTTATPGTATPPTGSATVPPTVSPAGPGGGVETLGPASVSGDPMYTLGDVAIVENVSTLTVTQAERGDSLSQLPPPAGQTAYTFLVVFSWDGTTPGPIQIGGGYHNAINFSLRDATAEAAFVELKYTPIADDAVHFRVQPLGG